MSIKFTFDNMNQNVLRDAEIFCINLMKETNHSLHYLSGLYNLSTERVRQIVHKMRKELNRMIIDDQSYSEEPILYRNVAQDYVNFVKEELRNKMWCPDHGWITDD